MSPVRCMAGQSLALPPMGRQQRRGSEPASDGDETHRKIMRALVVEAVREIHAQKSREGYVRIAGRWVDAGEAEAVHRLAQSKRHVRFVVELIALTLGLGVLVLLAFGVLGFLVL